LAEIARSYAVDVSMSVDTTFARRSASSEQAPEHRPAPKARPPFTIINALDNERL